MTSKAEVTRELLDRAILAIEHGTLLMSEAVDLADELRALLAAQEAPRQDPVGRVSYIGNGFIRVRCAAPPALETLLYTAPLSTDHSGGGAGVVLPERLGRCCDNAQCMTCSLAEGWDMCLDKVKELNQ